MPSRSLVVVHWTLCCEKVTVTVDLRRTRECGGAESTYQNSLSIFIQTHSWIHQVRGEGKDPQWLLKLIEVVGSFLDCDSSFFSCKICFLRHYSSHDIPTPYLMGVKMQRFYRPRLVESSAIIKDAEVSNRKPIRLEQKYYLSLWVRGLAIAVLQYSIFLLMLLYFLCLSIQWEFLWWVLLWSSSSFSFNMGKLVSRWYVIPTLTYSSLFYSLGHGYRIKAEYL